jgi:hypothetical protein
MSTILPVYVLCDEQYMTTFQSLLYSLQQLDFDFSKLTIVDIGLCEDDKQFFKEHKIKVLEVPSWYKNGEHPCQFTRLNYDTLLPDKAFISLDADVWLQDLECLETLSTTALRTGFAGVFAPRNYRKSPKYHNFLYELPKNLLQKNAFNTGVFAVNNFPSLFSYARFMWSHKRKYSFGTEQACFELSLYYHKIFDSLPITYNWLVDWFDNEQIEINNGKIFVNEQCIHIVHLLLKSKNKLFDIKVDGEYHRVLLRPKTINAVGAKNE